MTWRRWQFAASNEVLHGYDNPKKYIGRADPGRGAWAGRGAGRGVRLETQIVDAMNKAYGVHPGFRANHAKGVVAEGTFIATPEAARLSKAVIFNGSPIPVTVRFSDSTGIPNLPDGSALANPHGMAIKFHIPDGGETDMVINSLKFFPVSSGADFRDMLLAVAESPPGAPKPTKLEQFAASHPNMPRALATVQTPDSFADEEYYGVNAFILVNDKGERHAVRYVMAPEKLVHLTAEEAAKTAPDFLINELPARVARDSDSVNLGSNPGPPAMNPPQIAAYFWFPRSPE